MVYFFVIILLLFGFFYYDIYHGKKGKNELYWVTVGLMWAISAFSYRLGSDTINYMYEFAHETPILIDLTKDDLFDTYGRQPGWVLFFSLLKTIFPSFVLFKMVYAFLLNYSVAKFIGQNISKKFTALLLYFSFIYFPLNFEVLREGMAVACFLFSVKFFIQRRWLRYYLYVVASTLFHISAFPLLLLPLFTLLRSLKVKVVLTFFLCLLLLSFSDITQQLFYNLIGVESLADKALYYFSSETHGASRFSISNIVNYILNIFIPLILLYKVNQESSLYQYADFIIVYVLIYTVSLLLPIFFRCNNYFNIFYIIVYIEFLQFGILFPSLSRRSKRLICVCGVFVFCFLKLSVLAAPVGNIPGFYRFYPYSSIFTKTVDERREKIYLYLE